MNEAQNYPSQLPAVSASNGPAGAAVPPLQSSTPVQHALAILMDTTLSPYEVAARFSHLKEDYVAKTYGITIE